MRSHPGADVPGETAYMRHSAVERKAPQTFERASVRSTRICGFQCLRIGATRSGNERLSEHDTRRQQANGNDHDWQARAYHAD